MGERVARDLLSSVQAADPNEDFGALERAVGAMAGLPLRERVDLLSSALVEDVHGDYSELAGLVRAADGGRSPLDGWMIWPVTVAVARCAVDNGTDEAFDDALDLLASLTPKLTAEFALRILLRADVPRTLHAAKLWASDGDAHVRRLASEGTRPYLPWALRVSELHGTPPLTIEILDALHDDESEYVRRSVANHLNDLSRHAPGDVLAAATRWLQSPDPNTAWVVRHGLRTLVKQGNGEALQLLGFNGTHVKVEGFKLHHHEVDFPGDLGFTAVVRNDGAESARIAIDYVVYHLRSNGSHSPKTFKLASRSLEPGEQIQISRTHKFREITTRRYYNGPHRVALQVNGQRTEALSFDVVGIPPST